MNLPSLIIPVESCDPATSPETVPFVATTDATLPVELPSASFRSIRIMSIADILHVPKIKGNEITFFVLKLRL